MMHAADERCPACGKELFRAVYRAKGTPETACVDPECVNAHGIQFPPADLPAKKWRVGLEGTDAFVTKTVVIETESREEAGRLAEEQNPGWKMFWSNLA